MTAAELSALARAATPGGAWPTVYEFAAEFDRATAAHAAAWSPERALAALACVEQLRDILPLLNHAMLEANRDGAEYDRAEELRAPKAALRQWDTLNEETKP